VDTGAAIVSIHLPEGASPTTYYKYGPEPGNHTPHWYEFIYNDETGIGAVIEENIVKLSLRDGQWGDDDLIENGTIVDDGGPGSLVNQDRNSGCSISTSASGLLLLY
jgi:trimeric autotransporter adhesin